MSFPDYETVQDWMEEFVSELPGPFFEGLNLGVIMLEEVRFHPRSRPEAPLYVLGLYERSGMGAQIIIFYGSFRVAYAGYSEEGIRKALRHTLRHEFRHHVEMRSGFRDLEEEDAYFLAEYEKKYGDRDEKG